MPCRDDFPPHPETKKPRQRKLDPLLCEAFEIIENAGLKPKCSTELIVWAREHEGREQERVKREALAKLTKKERRALGLEK